ncbi:MAG: hypothetical protein M3Z95_04795, partial [Actinomycetota bacterium]|nr:hypothetical protein [Actinomycetota bacterium]
MHDIPKARSGLKPALLEALADFLGVSLGAGDHKLLHAGRAQGIDDVVGNRPVCDMLERRRCCRTRGLSTSIDVFDDEQSSQCHIQRNGLSGSVLARPIAKIALFRRQTKEGSSEHRGLDTAVVPIRRSQPGLPRRLRGSLY